MSTEQSAQPTIGVIGGTGFYSFFDDDAREIIVDTPYGAPSAPITVGTVRGADGTGVQAAFIPRHGRHHEFAPHTVPYRATMWALKSLGVSKVFAPCAVGSLTTDIGPGTMVVPDQLVDRTSGRTHTFFDASAVHVSFADPYCPQLRSAAMEAGAASSLSNGRAMVDGGTMVIVEGPRFSTRAESQWFAQQGWTLVNMTGHPEAVLARELQMCYSPVALVTDTDAGVAQGEGVSEQEVLRVFAAGLETLRSLLAQAIVTAAENNECGCAAGEHDISGIMEAEIRAGDGQ